jgi:hypothetical protein
MTEIRNWINLVENIDKEREFYINQANYYRTTERAKWWPVSPELMASYNDGSRTETDVNGSLVWMKDGVYHREGDKPAFIDFDGSLVWYKNGKEHRDGDKPAYIDADGTLVWYKNRLNNRDRDKPAVINANGTLVWFKNDFRHRLAGPAVIDNYNNYFQWYFKGEKIPVNSQEEFLKWLSDKGHIDVYRLRKQ